MLKYYTRAKSGRRTGCLVAVKDGSEVAIGFSKCKRIDPFNKAFGTEVAVERALHILSGERSYNIPDSMKDDYTDMEMRATRFFKGCVVVGVGE